MDPRILSNNNNSASNNNNKIAFDDDMLFIQRLKGSFVYFLWSETKLFIKDGP